jgi:hypothetical protein
MVITEDALNRVDQHWAIKAIGDDGLARALEVAKVRTMRSAVGHQMVIAFDETVTDSELVERVAMAYEMAAIEGLDALLHPAADEERVQLRLQAQAGTFRAYALRRTLPIPASSENRIFHVLHLSALAYCGDQWTDLRRWLKDHEREVKPPSVRMQLGKTGYSAGSSTAGCVSCASKDGMTSMGSERSSRSAKGPRTIRRTAHLPNPTTPSLKLRLFALLRCTTGRRRRNFFQFYAARATGGNRSRVGQTFRIGTTSSFSRTGRRSRSYPPLAARHFPTDGCRFPLEGGPSGQLPRDPIRQKRYPDALNVRALAPQRAALQEQGLLDQASRAVVVDLPTSGGKTTLAQFRMLQALNQFDADKGWVAYVAPTRALVAQLTRRLREDFSPLDILVEQLTGAIEIDAFEEAMLAAQSEVVPFHILVSTPEKLHLVIRNKKVARPLALVVMDEAHSIEDEERGLRIELLLATIKRECDRANFLLLMPFVPNAGDLARWLGADAGKTISIGTSPWQPNERAVGLFHAVGDSSTRGGWRLQYETLTTTPKTIHLRGQHQVGAVKPLDIPFSKAKGVSVQAGLWQRCSRNGNQHRCCPED